jgi:hypothetical protein
LAHLHPFEATGAHRLIPAEFSRPSVLETLPLPASVLADLSELDAATNERKIAERGGSTGIGLGELLYGVPEAHIVNAAFTHPGPCGARFHARSRGAWYACVRLETSVGEVSFHKKRFLANARIQGEQTFEYIDFLADFSGTFHRLNAAERHACLRPGPIPDCYSSPQALAQQLLYGGSSGVVYPSVRHRSGTCIACFRPALVFHPRRGNRYRLKLQAKRSAVAVDEVLASV